MNYNDYLVVGVAPANNEENVALNTNIDVRFSMDMDVNTINNSTLVLFVVNGPSVNCSIQYRNSTRTATLFPSVPLQGGTHYRLVVQSGETGIRTITGDGLSFPRNYEFTTDYTDVNVSSPTNVKVSLEDYYATVSWGEPSSFDPADSLTYEVMLSTSSTDPVEGDATIVWPGPTDVGNETSAMKLTIPAKLEEGYYYAYVRAKDSTDISGWVQSGFLVEAESPTDPTDPVDPGTPTTFFEITAEYPKPDQANVSNNSIKVLFSMNPDPASITDQTVYVIKAKKPDTLTIIDLMTSFAPDMAVSSTVQVNGALVSITLDELEENQEYTVIVRESVSSEDGETLGEPYYWSFLSTLTPLYGDPDRIRSDIKAFLKDVSDKTLYQYMHDASLYAEDILSQQGPIPDPIPYYVEQYVRFQTAYDLVVNSYVQGSMVTETGASGGGRRKLADLEIEVTGGSSSSQSTKSTLGLKELRDRIKPWLDRLHGHTNRGYAKPSVVVRGENGDPYPEHMSRVDFKDING